MIYFLVSVLILHVSVCGACETKFVHVFNESAFYFNESFLGSFQEATEYCESLGSSIASVHSHEENDFINQILGFVKTWIGLKRSQKNGTFEWVDSTPLDYNRTLPKNLNNNFECPKSSCCTYHTVLTRFFNRFGTYVEVWKQGSCDRLLGAICRRPMTQSDFTLSSSCDRHFDHVHHGLSYHYDPSLNMTFKAAQSYCKSMGSSLPMIQTQAQNEYLQFLVQKDEVWMGTTEVVAGKYVSFSWADGSSMNYTNFAEKANKAACNYFKCRGFVNRSGKWSGISVFAHLGVVCQKSISVEDGEDHTRESDTLTAHIEVEHDSLMESTSTCCPASFPHSLNGKRYHFNPGMKGSLNQSMAYCKSLGSTMATIDSVVENDFIHFNIANEASIWLPAVKRRSEHYDSWFNGRGIAFNKWYRKEPDCTGECCGIFLDTDNTWMSSECSSPSSTTHHVVCEKAASECTVSSGSECDDLFTHSFRGKSYFHVKGLLKSWNESKAFCSELQSDLVTISSKKQNQFLASLIATTGDVWLSAEKRQFLSYSWPSTGDSLVYTNWGPSAPSCSDPCCAIFMNSADGHWFDTNCTRNQGVICERDTRSMMAGWLAIGNNRDSRAGTSEVENEHHDDGNTHESYSLSSSSPQIIVKITALEVKIHKIREEITSKFDSFLKGSKKSEGDIQTLQMNLEKLLNTLKVMKKGEVEKEEIVEEGESHENENGEKRTGDTEAGETSSSSPLNYYIYAGITAFVLLSLVLVAARCPRLLFSVTAFDDLPVVKKHTQMCDPFDTPLAPRTPPPRVRPGFNQIRSTRVKLYQGN